MEQETVREKAQIRKVLQQNILKHLPGGPAQRHKARDEYLKNLDAARTKTDFMKALPDYLQRVLKETYSVN
jgi:hypothetical protein